MLQRCDTLQLNRAYVRVNGEQTFDYGPPRAGAFCEEVYIPVSPENFQFIFGEPICSYEPYGVYILPHNVHQNKWHG